MLSKRTFGVEIEHGNSALGVEGVYDELAQHYPTWAKCYEDGSGVEVISPVLCGKDGLAELKEVLAFLKKLGGTMGRKDGFHVHHGGKEFLDDERKVIGLLKSWHHNQPVISAMLPERRTDNGEIGGVRFCKVLDEVNTRKLLGFFERPDWPENTNVQTKTSHFNNTGVINERPDRFNALNVQSLAKHGTIEIRQHQGTWNFNRLSAWIHFGQKFVERCAAGHTLKARSTPTELMKALGLTTSEINLLRRVEQ